MRARIPIVAASVWLAACTEGIGPPPGPLHHLRWSPELGTPIFAALGSESTAEGPRRAAGVQENVILETYQTSFWAERGKDASVEIRYRAADGTWQPYVRLTVPRDALYARPDGSLFNPGEGVLITATVDPENLIVHFSPTGLVFSQTTPAQLQFWYTGADPDFDTSGAVDETDNYIRYNRLGLWVQEHPGDPWRSLAAAHGFDGKQFTAGLFHFSGHAVSW